MSYKLYSEIQVLASTISNQGSSKSLSEVYTQIKPFWEMYTRDRDLSPKASYDFCNDLLQIVTQYYDTHVYANKTRGQKFAAFFGFVNKSEKTFLGLQKLLKQTANEQQKLIKKTWDLPWYISIPLLLGNFSRDYYAIYKKSTHPKKYFGVFFNKISMKIRVIANRLMGNERYDSKDLERLPHDGAVYKVSRELFKFEQAFNDKLSPQFKTQLSETIKILNRYAELLARINFSLYIKNTSINDAYHEQRLRDICYEIKQDLLQLPLNGKYLIPWGFSSKIEGGHSAMVEVHRIDNDNYKFSFIDTGGLTAIQNENIAKLAWMHLVSGEGNIYLVENIKTNELIKTDIAEKIVRPLHHQSPNIDSGTKAMLAPVEEFKNRGRLSSSNASYVLQSNNTCSNQVLFAWLQTTLLEGLYRCFNYFVLDRSLNKLEHLRVSNNFTTRQIINTLEANHGQDGILRGSAVLDSLKRSGESQKAEAYKNIQDYVSPKFWDGISNTVGGVFAKLSGIFSQKQDNPNPPPKPIKPDEENLRSMRSIMGIN